VIARFTLRSRHEEKCLTDEAKKRLVGERLHEKSKCTGLERSGANCGCFPAVARNSDAMSDSPPATAVAYASLKASRVGRFATLILASSKAFTAPER